MRFASGRGPNWLWFRRCWVYLIHHDGCTSSYTPGACSLKSLGVVRARVGCLNPEVCRWKVERNIWFCSGEQQRENQNVQSVTLLPRVLVAVGALLVFVIAVIREIERPNMLRSVLNIYSADGRWNGTFGFVAESSGGRTRANYTLNVQSVTLITG